MPSVYTCADIRRLITKGDLKNQALKEHVPGCKDCLEFGRTYLKEKKLAEAAGRAMKSDPQVMAAQMLAMAEEQREQRPKTPKWKIYLISFGIASLLLIIMLL